MLCVYIVWLIGFYKLKPVVEKDTSGATAYFWGPVYLCILILTGICGLLFGAWAAHKISSARLRRMLIYSAVAGYLFGVCGIYNVYLFIIGIIKS